MYLEVQLYGMPERIPLTPGGGRKSTLERWYREGLPGGLIGSDVIREAYRQAGGTCELPESGPAFSVNHRMIPEFEQKVLEVRADSQIVQDWKGNVCEIGLEFDVSYLNNAVDFVTRNWLKCPVETRSDWDDMKKRYNPTEPGRFPQNPVELGGMLDDRSWYVPVHFHGPYWQLREWCGFEGLSMMFYDNPLLVKDMIYFWQEYVAVLLNDMLKYFVPDEIHISEDMAYKGYSMVSPEMAREFLLPCWKRWGEIIHGAGIPVYAIDSDGFIEELIPVWIKAGVNACDPIEVAAGNDINKFRKMFGRDMAYRGGVDKREMAKGGRFIEAEIERLMPVIQDGGFIPGCDHGVPHDVSWPNFVYYTKLLAGATGWL
jgi:uroporphyrinogen decarboxylase